MKRHRKTLARLLAAMLCLCLLAGCGSQPTQTAAPEPEPEPAPAPAEETVVMPAPEHYFGMAATSVDGDYYTFNNIPENPWNAFACYARLLADNYGLVLDANFINGADFYSATLLHPESSDFKVNLTCSKIGEGNYTVGTWFYGPVRFEDLEVLPAPVPVMTGPVKGELPVEAPDFPLALQGPMLYLGHDSVVESVERKERDGGTIRYDYILSIPFEKCQEMMQYYIDTYLLGELGLRPDGVDDDSANGTYRAFFACSGAEGYVNSSGEQEASSCAMIGCRAHEDDGNFTKVALVCSPSFAVEEMAPMKTENVPAPAPEPEPEPEEEPSSGWVDCPSCYGGQCSACSGRGGKDQYSPGLPREWEPCWKCHGDGDCGKCNGRGKVLA